MLRPVQTKFIHLLLRARDWQDRPEFLRVCDWWRGGGRGVFALVGLGGTGKTAIADRFVSALPGLTEPLPDQPQDASLLVPKGLFVFSFFDAPNPDQFFDDLYDWLVAEFHEPDRRRILETGQHMQASATQVIDALSHVRQRLLLVLDGVEKVQDDGSRGGQYGHLTDGGLRTSLLWAAAGRMPGVAVLITTRFVLDDLEYERERGTAPLFQSLLIEEISDAACIALLRHRGVRGGDDELHQLGRDCGRHALTVDLVAGYLSHFCDGDPHAPLNLPTAEELRALVPEHRDRRLRHIVEQSARFHRLAQSYHEALSNSDPAALALLQRVCLFRFGVNAQTLASVFTGRGKDNISGPALATLTQRQLQAKLSLLADMGLLVTEEAESQKEVAGRTTGELSSLVTHASINSVHPAIRDAFLGTLDVNTVRLGHDAARNGLLASLGELPDKGSYPADATTLDILEEILFHMLQIGESTEAWELYSERIGRYDNLGYRLGAYERCARICRLFARGKPAQVAEFPNHRYYYNSSRAWFFEDWGRALLNLGRLNEALVCFSRLKEPNVLARSKERVFLCTTERNVSHIHFLAGNLRRSLQAAENAISLAQGQEEDGDDGHPITQPGFAFCFAARRLANATIGGILGAIRDHERAIAMNSDAAVYGRAGIEFGILLLNLRRISHARRIAEETRKRLLADYGEADNDAPFCLLLLAECDLASGRYEDANARLSDAYDYAIRHNVKDLLCWSLLVRARIMRSAYCDSPAAAVNKPSLLEGSRSALEDGLKVARDCGYGLYHIDLLLVRAQLALNDSRPDNALDDLTLALDQGVPANEATAQPQLLAATDEDCGYAWGIAKGRHLRGEALLLKAAQKLGDAIFAPKRLDCLPPDLQQYIALASEQLGEALKLWRELCDPESDADINPQGERTKQVLGQLAGGVLTEYSLEASVPEESTESQEFQEPDIGNNPMTRTHVFLSYCGDNRADVAKLRDELMVAGEPVWWDQDILPGQNWELEIDMAMRAAYAVVLCLSKESQARTATGMYPEVRNAIETYRLHSPGDIFLIPVRLSDCQIPSFKIDATTKLDGIQFVDLFPPKQRAAGVEKLIRALQAALHHP
jgi:tetratricopeptide (TPR) repeat protein